MALHGTEEEIEFEMIDYSSYIPANQKSKFIATIKSFVERKSNEAVQRKLEELVKRAEDRKNEIV